MESPEPASFSIQTPQVKHLLRNFLVPFAAEKVATKKKTGALTISARRSWFVCLFARRTGENHSDAWRRFATRNTLLVV
jgi:hypothetical protein